MASHGEGTIMATRTFPLGVRVCKVCGGGTRWYVKPGKSKPFGNVCSDCYGAARKAGKIGRGAAVKGSTGTKAISDKALHRSIGSVQRYGDST
jgi:hypothetical protein